MISTNGRVWRLHQGGWDQTTELFKSFLLTKNYTKAIGVLTLPKISDSIELTTPELFHKNYVFDTWEEGELIKTFNKTLFACLNLKVVGLAKEPDLNRVEKDFHVGSHFWFNMTTTGLVNVRECSTEGYSFRIKTTSCLLSHCDYTLVTKEEAKVELIPTFLLNHAIV